MYSAADPYLNIHKKPPRATHRLAPILESRAAEQAALREQVFSTTLFQSLPQPSNLTIVDIGCGTGAIARELARRPNVRTVLGIDPAPYLIEEAQRLAAADPHANKINGKMEFRVGLGAALPVGDGIADLAVIWTVLCHVPPAECGAIIKEARRILKPGGRLVLADNDLSGWSVAIGPHDPLSAPLAWFVNAYIQEPWLCKKFPTMLSNAGLEPGPLQLHTVVDTTADSYGFQHVLLSAIEAFASSGRGARAH